MTKPALQSVYPVCDVEIDKVPVDAKEISYDPWMDDIPIQVDLEQATRSDLVVPQTVRIDEEMLGTVLLHDLTGKVIENSCCQRSA